MPAPKKVRRSFSGERRITTQLTHHDPEKERRTFMGKFAFYILFACVSAGFSFQANAFGYNVGAFWQSSALQRAYVKASNTTFNALYNPGSEFGFSVSIDGDSMAVGAMNEDSNATGVNGNQANNLASASGAVYVFTRTAGVWSQEAYIKASNTATSDSFGTKVSLSVDTLAVSAPSEASNATGINGNQSDNSNMLAGAVYVFTRTAGVWSQQAYIKSSNNEAIDSFGSSISLDVDTLAVGASGEDSNATGVGGNQADNTAGNSGAVYVFTRTAGVWSQQAYIKSSNAESLDSFGANLSLSGDTLAVGASGEDSNATGVGGNQADNSALSSGAVYVFTRTAGVWSQQAYLKASNTEANDLFGSFVGINGDTLAVVASGEDSIATGIGGNQADNSALGSGAVYVFTRTAGVWSQQAYIKASNTAASDTFGVSISVSGDTLAVGANGEDSVATGIGGNQADNTAADSGAVYVFTRTAGVWSQQAYIKASNTATTDWFGYAVSVSGDSLVAGARQEDSNATGVGGNQADNTAANSGAVYVFTRTAGVWSQQAYVKSSNTTIMALYNPTSIFGVTLSLDGDTLAVGAYQEDSNSTGVNGVEANNLAINSGAVYVFNRTAGVWSQQAYIKASNTETSDAFGFSISVSGDTLAVGANAEDSNATGVGGNQADNTAGNSGAVYVFTRTAGVWSQQAYLKASNSGINDNFGEALSLSGDTLAVGAYGEDSVATGIGGNQADNTAGNAGAVYVFTRTAGLWSQQAYIKASNTATNDAFGDLVSLSGDTLAVVASGEDSSATGIGGNQADNTALSSGAVYVFTRTAGVWSQQAYIKASNTAANDNFGQSIALDGDTLAVGAMNEDSNAKGIGGNQADNSALNSGAVYVFKRTAGVWSQDAYVKASNTEASDGFGVSVSVSGDTLAVGAHQEDSLVAGINGNQADNTSVSTGAVYIFNRGSAGVWSQSAYIKASNPTALDNFGNPVSVSGSTLAVGASQEDSNATGIDGNQSDNSANSAGAAYIFSL